ncbi:SICA antigen [Plasmodium coatneyi]|uniref:SICA antigen n=1 Tax=Plasmodium coatneyi TaxID=208452 RepID=A0A1B1E2U4_9APIC|nr:SICA antigen [Plasmodium coatneyi]ANQ09334.1 SICA antigen [Plasmodium coatneyi]
MSLHKYYLYLRTDIWNDMEKRINPLAEAMSNTDAAVDNYCTSTDEKNKEACRQIVSGLMHVYKTQGERSSEKSSKGNSRIFHQTMKCAFLNAYADMLENKDPCKPLNGVKEAFNKSTELHKQLCQDDTNCVECIREKNLGCTVKVRGNLLNNYFFIGKKRKRYKRAPQVSGPPSLEEQLLDRVDDQDDGPHVYTLVKERRQPRSLPTGRTKRPKKRVPGLRAGRRGVGHRMIIDIHLEVLDECQKGDLHSRKEDFFEILIQAFMGSNFIKEENIPKEDVPKKEDQSSDSGFSVDVPKKGSS